MSFKNIQNIRMSYHSISDDVAERFYIPCLKEARIYKRAVGYFSSNILLQISKGLGAFIDNGGKMKLLVSTRLDEEDYNAIKKGYDEREILLNKIVDQFDFSVESLETQNRYEMLAFMIAHNRLDVKIVALKENNDNSLFHIKNGIMIDEDDNIITFSGSGNETINGYYNNYEEFDVFCSWSSDESNLRCSEKDFNFDCIWNGTNNGLITIPFPEVIKNHILKFKSDNEKKYATIDQDFIDKRFMSRFKPKTPNISKLKILRDYQMKAIVNWEKNDYRGIFDMATGTGKTYTGAGAITKLYETKKRLVVVICAPFTHLVDQWCDELLTFDIEAIKCYGSTNYDVDLKRALLKFKQKRSNFVCAVICNASLMKDSLQELFSAYSDDLLLVADEAHNLGAEKSSKILNPQYKYRLALSATLDRHNDEEGTERLYNYFGDKCIEYTLDEAIRTNKLTKYYYYPVIVTLNSDEYEEYCRLSTAIGKARLSSKDKNLSEYAKALLIKRARLIAGVEDKVNKLSNLMNKYQDKNNMLVYCGAVKYGEKGYNDANDEKKQIEIVYEMLKNDHNMYISKFTAEEDTETRKGLLNAFKKGEIQALIAIKCLDEGMNIPAIKTAFILASSTNPKEYIQRRGRVLRQSPETGKEYAEIYDFITLPYDIYDGKTRMVISNIEKNLARRELDRVNEFARLSSNPSDSLKLESDIRNYFNMNIIEEDEHIYD